MYIYQTNVKVISPVNLFKNKNFSINTRITEFKCKMYGILKNTNK